MSSINHDYIQDYLTNIIPEHSDILKEMEIYATENHVPIITKDVAELLKVLIKLKSPKSILEVGTAIGYSSILMAKYIENDFKILTVERNQSYIDIANKNIESAGLKDKIQILSGDAEEILKEINDSFDIIFVDAAKGQYMDFFKDTISKLKIGGLFICDNVLFRGMVAEKSLVIRRKITIVKRLRKFLEYISNNEALQTSIIPIGDGVSISCKLKEVIFDE